MPRPRSTAGAATQSRDRSNPHGPAPRTDTNVTTRQRGSALVSGDDSRRPDEGASASASDQLREQWMRERARREFVTASLRSHLAEQPNARAVRACARRWISDLNNLADGVIAAMTSTETEE
jgi:hypothetical protein